MACTIGGEDCGCAAAVADTAASPNGTGAAVSEHRKTTKYRFEMDLLISKDVGKFKRVDQWNFAAPACSVNLN